jgi:hypothetical protein
MTTNNIFHTINANNPPVGIASNRRSTHICRAFRDFEKASCLFLVKVSQPPLSGKKTYSACLVGESVDPSRLACKTLEGAHSQGRIVCGAQGAAYDSH